MTDADAMRAALTQITETITTEVLGVGRWIDPRDYDALRTHYNILAQASEDSMRIAQRALGVPDYEDVTQTITDLRSKVARQGQTITDDAVVIEATVAETALLVPVVDAARDLLTTRTDTTEHGEAIATLSNALALLDANESRPGATTTDAASVRAQWDETASPSTRGTIGGRLADEG